MRHSRILLAAAIAAGPALYGQTPTISSVVDGFTFDKTSPRLAPGGVASIFGTNFGTSKSIAVTLGGKQAYLYAVMDQQINLEIPVDAPLGATTVTVGGSAPFNVTLAQYAPAVLSANGSGTGPVGVVSSDKGPFKAGDQFAIVASGLGPTTPSIATGVTSPSGTKTNATVTATIGGVAATVPFAGLAPGGIGTYQVNVTVPAGLPTGNLPLVLTVGGVSSQAGLTVPITGTAAPAPTISGVLNAASLIVQGLPNGGIAQGAIFVVKGSNLGPASLTIDPHYFNNTSLAGTSASVKVNGTTVNVLMYYTSAGQVAGLLPSNTPVGTGTITVTYNNATSAPAPITVVQNNLAIFTWTQDGAGVGLVTYPDYSLVSPYPGSPCGGPYTTCGAANPGDVLILWATGLGPVSGSDASGSGLGVNMPNIPLTLWLGGVQIKASYQGRSGCCVGEDQIVFTVPNNAPTGCAVPLAVQINDQISNYTVLPVASSGRTCTPSTPFLSDATTIQSLGNGAPFTYSQVKLNRRPVKGGNEDRGDVRFYRVSTPAALQPIMLSLIDNPSTGTCVVYNNLNGSDTTSYFKFLGGPDAGPSITFNGPNGSRTLPKQSGSGPTDYNLTLGPGNYLSPGAYTITGPGGADIGAISAAITIPQMPVWSNQASLNTVTRANGVTFTWTGSAAAYVEIGGGAATDQSFSNGALFDCYAPAAAGTFTVPPSVLLALPAGPGELIFQPNANPASFTASGLTLGFVTSNFQTVLPATFQ